MNAAIDDEAPQSPEDPVNDLVDRAQHEPAPAEPAASRRYPDDVSDDDRDTGWGERPGDSGRDDDWYLRERPPHHG